MSSREIDDSLDRSPRLSNQERERAVRTASQVKTAAAAVQGKENKMAAEEGGEKMVILRSEDGMDFVVSVRAARFLVGTTVCKYRKIICLDVNGKTLAQVIQYCNEHASSSSGDDDDPPCWDAKFVGDVDLQALYGLILLGFNYFQAKGLLDLACQTLANKIKGKSPHEICDILNISSVFTSELHEEQLSGSCASHKFMLAMKIVSDWWNQEVVLVEKALNALHIVRCQEFTEYDPKRCGFVRTRFSDFNIAFFDFDKESSFCRGPPLHKISPMGDSVVQSCLNVISFKVCESDVGFPIDVFGTIVARDQVDYRCVHLIRRERDDPQFISSWDDALSLIDPCRALVSSDDTYFEIDLKIKCDGGVVKKISKGVVAFNWTRLDTGKDTMTLVLNSCLSRVELVCAEVYRPVEATIAINILKGPCSISRVAAWTPGNFKHHIILYEAAGAGGSEVVVIGDGGSVPLTRRVVAVSLDNKLALALVGGDDDVFEKLVITLGHSDEVINGKMGDVQLEVKVAWTAVPVRKRPNLTKLVGNVELLL